MRTEHEMLDQLLTWAIYDENIRAVLLTGSRADPSRTVDDLSDYDLSIVVRDVTPITSDPTWPEWFGPIMVRWPLTPQSTFDPTWITQLVLYDDGVRIDFQFTTIDITKVERPAEYFCVLVDKDDQTRTLAGLPIDGARIDPPDEHQFRDRINAFWWDIPYVAKALARGELPYARFVLEGDLRFNKLHPLLRWYIGIRHGPDTDVGVAGRWFQRYLEPAIWDRYLETFSAADIEDNRRAMFAMTALIRLLGREIANHYGFTYPEEVDQKVSAYLARTAVHPPHVGRG